MKVTGNYIGAHEGPGGTLSVTFSINEKAEGIAAINDMDHDTRYFIEVKPFRKRRSLDANGMLWACLGEMAQVLGMDKWDVYIRELKSYGVFTYITILPDAVPKLKEIWRECEEVGQDPDGKKQFLCYFGSSTYNTKEFAALLNGVVSDMKDLGLYPPLPEEIEKSLALWQRKEK